VTGPVTVPVTVRDLAHADLADLRWCGPPSHLRNVSGQLDRAARGEVVYLALCGPAGLPIAVGGADLARRAGTGRLYQLAVLPELQSCGLGTRLIGALEDRVRERGLSRVDLGVGEDNLRARALYERLGYVAYGSEVDRWSYERDDGSAAMVEDLCTLLGKDL
jgi:ribosomal protein S18 acetylase RimI-like enzyme